MIAFSHYPGAGSFLDPQLIRNEEGKLIPYGPFRYEAIVKEQYWITKELHTSYLDLEQITPKDRSLLLRFIDEDNKKAEEHLKNLKKANNK